MSPSITASVSDDQKKTFKKKAEELGISQAELIRMLCFKNLPNLVIGYRSRVSYSERGTDITRLKPPRGPELMTKEHLSMKECVKELKDVFAKGTFILSRMEDAEVGIKSEEELEVKAKEAEEKIYQRLEKQLEEVK